MTFMKWRVVARGLLCFVLGVVLSACPSREEAERKPAPPSASPFVELPEGTPILTTLRTERVAIRSMKQVVAAQAGKILANENRLAHLSPRVPGRIVTVYANLGDHVKPGDRLLLLDSPALGAAQLDYRKANARLSVAQKAFERAKQLLDKGVIGTAEYQRREEDYLNSQAELQQADEHLHLLGMTEEDIAKLTRGELPHAQAAQVPLRSSIGGVVIERNATVGEVVDPSKSVFTVADLSTVWVGADFPEQQAALLKVGLPIEVRVQAYPGEIFTGRVTYVSSVVDSATRTVMVRSDVQNSDRRLRPEMFAEVALITDERPTLTVPKAAVQHDGERTTVFVVRGPRKFERREVTLGQASGGWVAVRTGLLEGDIVVTEGSYALKSESLRGRMQEGAP